MCYLFGFEFYDSVFDVVFEFDIRFDLMLVFGVHLCFGVEFDWDLGYDLGLGFNFESEFGYDVDSIVNFVLIWDLILFLIFDLLFCLC